MTPTEARELTVEAAAVRAAVSAATMARWVAAGKVRSRRDHRGRRLIELTSLEEFLAVGSPVESAASGNGT